MKMKIALAGGGNAEDSLHIDEHFSQWNGENGKMLYIPIALRNTDRSFVDCYNWVCSALNPLGISKIEMWTDLTKHNATELDKFDSIYIGGGNTYSLLSELMDSDFDQIFRHYAIEGMPIYGGSAGAVVLGRDIRTVEHIDSNDIGLKRHGCLDIAIGYSIWVHYQSSDDVLIRKYVNATQYNVLAISERSGVIIEDGIAQSVGFESVYHFDKKRKQKLQ